MDYLSDRRQIVTGDSDTLPLSHGVAQGSLVGPILFLIFINDLSNFLPHGRLLPYVSVQLLDSAVPNSVGLSNLNVRINWIQSNSPLSKKTDFMLIGTRPSLKGSTAFTSPFQAPIYIIHLPLRLLGVHIDQHVTWESHIWSVVRRCYAILVSLFKNRHHPIPETMKLLVQVHVFPHILYCLSVWGGAAECHLSKVQKTINFASGSWLVPAAAITSLHYCSTNTGVA